jgi:DNA-binding SARP family transcriptional activator/tetratricopeptide (TPR) repeat protein
VIHSLVAILGPVAVSRHGRVVALGGTNLPALLCLLALSPGRAVSNQRLIGSLWPDADRARASRSLSSLVHQLNQTIDPMLDTDRAVRTVRGVGRALRVDPSCIDAVLFERGVADGEAHASAGRYDASFSELSAVLSLWRGEPFGGLDLPILVEPAARLAGTRRRVEGLLVDSALRCGRAGNVLPMLERQVETNPEDEELVASLARALFQVGRHDDALAVVHRCVERLHRRGIEPTPSLRRLADAIAEPSDPGRERAVVVPERRTPAPVQLIGRHSERAEIGNWFVGATAPRSVGRLLVITGDPGIGKTAVLDAWLAGAGDRIVTIRTRCSPEQILPFEAFAPLIIADRGTLTADGRRASPSAAPDGPRTLEQLFERVTGSVNVMSRGRPVVLAIDDAQWLTPLSVALLDHLIGEPQLTRLRVILTLRHHELPSNEPLQRLLDDLDAGRRVTTLTLGPLSDDEMERLAARHRSTGPQRRTDGLQGDDLRSVTGGNPLFVIQVAQAGGRIPDVPVTVEHLLGRYLVGQRAAVLLGVETAALLGIEGSLARLARCTDRNELDEIEALDAVGDGRLVNVFPIDGTYRFVHELARRTVIAQMPIGRRMRLHLAIADGLEREQVPDVFAIAHHLRLAVPVASPRRTTTALLAASRRARELVDFETSRVLAEQALGTTHERPLQADALVLMASGAQSLGDREAAAEHIGTAVQLAVESNDTAVLARALFVKSTVMCFWGADPLATRIEQANLVAVADAAAGAADAADAAEIVEVIWALCLERPSQAVRVRRTLAERALQVARASGNDLAILQGLNASQLAGQMNLTDPETVIAWGEEALDLARRTGHVMMSNLISSQLANSLMRAGRLTDAKQMNAELVQIEPTVADLAFRWANRARTASLALAADELELAERLVLEARDIGEPLAGTRPAEEYINHMAVLHLARGALPGLHHLFGSWFDQPPSSVWHWAVAPGELLDPTDPHAIERRETLVANTGNPVPPHSQWLAELTIAAEFAHRRADHDLGKIVARCIEPFVHQHAVFGVSLSLGSMWRPYALALAAAGDSDNAPEAMATARLVNAGADLALWERLSRL